MIHFYNLYWIELKNCLIINIQQFNNSQLIITVFNLFMLFLLKTIVQHQYIITHNQNIVCFKQMIVYQNYLSQTLMINLQKTHIMKFVIDGKAINSQRGKKCMPQQTYGISDQSPHHFKGQNGLINHGYIYKHQDSQGFDYFSQKKYFSIDGIKQPNFQTVYNQKKPNQFSFHRKKGRLSQFLDKNGWMNQVTPLMGKERSPQARRLSNNDVRKKINSLVHRNKQKNQYKTLQYGYVRGMADLISQKNKIRTKRNQLAQMKSLSSPKKFDPLTKTIDVQTTKDMMAMSMKDWNSTKQTFYKPFSAAKQQKCTVQFPDDPDIWRKTACSSKWVYRKNPKLISDQSQDSLYK